MSQVIETRHIQRTIEFLTAKHAEYTEQAESYARQGFENLAGWYEGRGCAFGSAAQYLQNDLDCFAEDAE